MKRVELGRLGELVACDYLLKKGWELIRRNYRCSVGEMDIIMRDAHWIVFVEVRTRSSDRWGKGEETIDYRKQKRLLRIAGQFLAGYHGIPGEPRFDLVSIQITGDSQFELNHTPAIIIP